MLKTVDSLVTKAGEVGMLSERVEAMQIVGDRTDVPSGVLVGVSPVSMAAGKDSADDWCGGTFWAAACAGSRRR